MRRKCHLAETPLDVREIGFLNVGAERRDPSPRRSNAVFALEADVDDPGSGYGLGLAGDLLGRKPTPLPPKPMELEFVDPALTSLERGHCPSLKMPRKLMARIGLIV